MRSLKTSGGLTRGRGMTERQRVIWLLSMPACAEMNRAMLVLTGVSYSEQNKDMTKSRQAGHEGHSDAASCFSRKKSFDNSYRSDKRHDWRSCREFC